MVLDSNVLVSGLVFDQGNPARIIQLVRDGEIAVCVSAFILEEVVRSFEEDFGWSRHRVKEAVDLLRSCCEVLDPPPEAALGSLTPADNRILDCALHVRAQCLVTGDKGIQRVGSFQGIPIVNPAEFIRIFSVPPE